MRDPVSQSKFCGTMGQSAVHPIKLGPSQANQGGWVPCTVHKLIKWDVTI